PTRQPVRLPEGDYRVRLSAPYRLSETFQMLVERGRGASHYRIDLSERLVGEPLPCNGTFECVPRGDGTAGHDVLTGVSDDTLSRYDGVPSKLQWTVTLGPDDRPGPSRGLGAEGPRDEPKRSHFFQTWLQANTADSGGLSIPEVAPRLLQPCRDLDGDGVPDLVWASPWLLALSGKDGKFLWDFRPAPCRGALWFGPDEAGRPLLLCLFAAPAFAGDEARRQASAVRWAEAIDGRTGQSVWRFRFENEWFIDDPNAGQHNSPPQMSGPWMMKVAGRLVLVCLAGSRLVGL